MRQPPCLVVAVAPLEHAQIQVLLDDLVERVLERAGHDLIRVAQRNPLVLLQVVRLAAGVAEREIGEDETRRTRKWHHGLVSDFTRECRGTNGLCK